MNKKFAGIALVFLALTFSPIHFAATSEAAYSESLTPATWAQEMLDMVNQIRATGCQCGQKFLPPTSPLTWDGLLERAALSHAGDMQSREFFSHRGSNGTRVGERATRASYSWRTVGENIAWGQRSVREVVQAWKNSPGHCRNLMDRDFKDFGAAKQGKYWVQVFGAKMK